VTWDDLAPGDVVFPNSDSPPWLVTWRGRDEHGFECLRCLDLHTGCHGEVEAGATRLVSAVRVLRGGEDVNR
jgi:hypothetical protein